MWYVESNEDERFTISIRVISVTGYLRSLIERLKLRSQPKLYGAMHIEATLSYNVSVGKIEALLPLCVSTK